MTTGKQEEAKPLREVPNIDAVGVIFRLVWLEIDGTVFDWLYPFSRATVYVTTRTPTVDGRNFAPPNKPWNDDSPVNTNKKSFPMVRNGFCPSTV